MKVTLKYEPEDDELDEVETSFSFTLPKAWLTDKAERVTNLFVDQFNKKHGSEATPLDKANCRLETKSGQVIASDAVIESTIKDGDEMFVRRGKGKDEQSATKPKIKQPETAEPPKATTASTESAKATKAPSSSAHPPGSLPCKRFGCGKRFVPGQPSEPCRHHKKPPVFHETRKYWACCPDKIAWDWDSFQTIEGCETLPEHSNETDATARRVMGGTDIRAENQPKEIGAEKKLTGLDKLFALRSALVQVGVSGDLFDQARDSIKRVHEDAEGKNVWDKVCSELTTVFEGAFQNVVQKD